MSDVREGALGRTRTLIIIIISSSSSSSISIIVIIIIIIIIYVYIGFRTIYLYTYICIYTYIYIYTCIHTHIHVYIYIYISSVLYYRTLGRTRTLILPRTPNLGGDQRAVWQRVENSVVQNMTKRIAPRFSVQSLCLKSLWSLPTISSAAILFVARASLHRSQGHRLYIYIYI